jgi:hypothetical protein
LTWIELISSSNIYIKNSRHSINDSTTDSMVDSTIDSSVGSNDRDVVVL